MIAEHEWDTLCLLIEEGWPGEFDDQAAKAWRVLLDDFNAKQVLDAVKVCVARGGRFRPAVSEVVAEIRRDPAKPTFTEAFRLIYGARGVLKARPTYPPGGWSGDELALACDRLALARADQLHPLVGAFIRAYGLTRLRMLELDDPEYGELRRKELRADWEQFVEANEGREVAALVAGRRRKLGAFDPLAALGLQAPAQITEGTGG